MVEPARSTDLGVGIRWPASVPLGDCPVAESASSAGAAASAVGVAAAAGAAAESDVAFAAGVVASAAGAAAADVAGAVAVAASGSGYRDETVCDTDVESEVATARRPLHYSSPRSLSLS